MHAPVKTVRLINNIILKYISYLKQLLLPEFFFNLCSNEILAYFHIFLPQYLTWGEGLCLCSHWHIFNMCVSEREMGAGPFSTQSPLPPRSSQTVFLSRSVYLSHYPSCYLLIS